MRTTGRASRGVILRRANVRIDPVRAGPRESAARKADRERDALAMTETGLVRRARVARVRKVAVKSVRERIGLVMNVPARMGVVKKGVANGATARVRRTMMVLRTSR